MAEKLPLTDRQVRAIVDLIADRLRAMREPLYDQAGFAKSAGMNASKYGPMERKKTYYRIDSFVRALHQWDIDILDLFDGKLPKKHKDRRTDPIIQSALEEVEEVLRRATPDNIEHARWNIRSWHDALPKRD